MDEYVDLVRARLTSDGCTVSNEIIESVPVLFGYRTEVRALSKMHVFIAVVKTDRVGEMEVRRFVDTVVRLAENRKGRWRGVQSGIIVLPVIVSTAVGVDAEAIVRRAYRLNRGGFAIFAQPAIVDITNGIVQTFRGTRLWGYAFTSLIKRKYAAYLPDPSLM